MALSLKKTAVFSFESTTQAMHMQIMAREKNIPGRMIPLPGDISAGCGLAWAADALLKDEIEELLVKSGIEYEKSYIIMH